MEVEMLDAIGKYIHDGHVGHPKHIRMRAFLCIVSDVTELRSLKLSAVKQSLEQRV